MKNLIIKDLYSLKENNNKTEDDHVLIISNRTFNETKKYLKNIQYDYFVCNNTLFDSNDNILYSNYINFDSENFLSFAYNNKKSPYISITDPKDESSLTNFVKISIKYNLLVDLGFIIDELEKKYGLSYNFEKGFFNFFVKNGLKNIISFLFQKNDYNNIFNYSNNIDKRKLREENYVDIVKSMKVKKYRR